MSDFDEKLKSICTYHSDDGTSGYQLSEEQFDQIKQLISEVIESYFENKHFASSDKANEDSMNFVKRIAYKELRHAFNLKGE